MQREATARVYWHSNLVSVLHTATLNLVPFAHILYRKMRPKLSFHAFYGIFVSALFGLESVGIIDLAGKAKVLRAIICVGGAVLVTVCTEKTINPWSSSLLLKESNASTDDDESDSEILIKGSLLIVPILGEFILQPTRPVRRLALQQKGRVSLDLKPWNYRGGLAVIVFLLMMNTAVVSKVAAATVDNTGTTSSAGGDGDVQVGDKLPSDCQYVDNCGFCLQCDPSGTGFNCCN